MFLSKTCLELVWDQFLQVASGERNCCFLSQERFHFCSCFLTFVSLACFLCAHQKPTAGSRQGVPLHWHRAVAIMARFSLWHMALLLWAVLCAGVSATLDSDLNCDVASVVLMGDGRCDEAYNTQACGFDGGDCCECTCWDNGESSIAMRGVPVMIYSSAKSTQYALHEAVTGHITLRTKFPPPKRCWLCNHDDHHCRVWQPACEFKPIPFEKRVCCTT